MTQLGKDDQEEETWESYVQERSRQQDEFVARFLTSDTCDTCGQEDIVYLPRRMYGKTLTLARLFVQRPVGQVA